MTLSSMVVDISTEVGTCLNSQRILQWISKQPLTIESCFNVLNTLHVTNESRSRTRIYIYRKKLFYHVSATEVTRSMLKVNLCVMTLILVAVSLKHFHMESYSRLLTGTHKSKTHAQASVHQQCLGSGAFVLSWDLTGQSIVHRN